MSIKVTTWAWAKSESRNGARLVMLALADRADDDGRAWPSIDDLSERTRLSPRAVQKGIAALVEMGELEVEPGGGRRVRNRYRIIPKPCTNDGVTGEEPRTSDGVSGEEPRRNDGVSNEETPHFEAETPHSATETPHFEHENPVNSAGEPPLEPPREPSGNHHLPARPSPDGIEADRLPEWVTQLQDAMSAAGINVPWRFAGDDLLRLHEDVKRLGIPLMVQSAVDAAAGASKRPFSSRWFYGGWHKMRTPAVAASNDGNDGNVVPFPSHQRQSDDMFDRAMARARARTQQQKEIES